MEQPNAPVPGGQPMPEGDPAMPPEGAMGEAQQASPEEQAAYEHFIAKAYELVYDKKMYPKMIDMLEGEGDPIEGLARAAAMVIKRIVDLAESAGEKLSGDIVLHAGTEVFEDLANLSKVAKIKDFGADKDAMEAAYFRALDMFRAMLQESGKIDQKAAAADLEKLMAMDQDGQLETLFRNLAADDEKGEAAPEEAAEGMPKRPGGPTGGLMQEAE